jgi:hypothetical protein
VTAPCTTEPMACSLAPAAYDARIILIESLAKRALRGQARSGLMLFLRYAPEVAVEVQQLVDQERKCCPFLTFELLHSEDACCLTITAPEAARESADLLFAPFLAPARQY